MRLGAWFYQPGRVRTLWRVGALVLGATVLAQFVFPVHGHFALEGVFGFSALYGFAACVVLVWGARLLGRLIKRPDDYYDP